MGKYWLPAFPPFYAPALKDRGHSVLLCPSVCLSVHLICLSAEYLACELNIFL